VAVDATLVSPVRSDGTNRPRITLREATDHKRRSTYPELRGAARCRLVVAFLQRLARGKALDTRFLPTLATPLPGRRRWAPEA
ncbi:unnamed protein product, partial [Effrenium voratum]